jgi:hypothetical protein
MDEFFVYLTTHQYRELYRGTYNHVLHTVYIFIMAAVRDKATTLTFNIHGIGRSNHSKPIDWFSFDDLGMRKRQQKKLAAAHFKALHQILNIDSTVQRHLKVVSDTTTEIICEFVRDN